jgi:hypothetical protein
MGNPQRKEPEVAALSSQEFPLAMQYGRHFDELCAVFHRENNFEGRPPEIKFPSTKTRGRKPSVINGKLLQLPYGTGEDTALSIITSLGWEPAEPEHLLAWGFATFIQDQTWKNTLGLGKQKTRISSCAYTGKGPYRVFLEFVPDIQNPTQHLGGADNRYLMVRS